MFEKDKQPQPSFVVISNGAEVVQISRSLFTSKLDFNARERLRGEVRNIFFWLIDWFMFSNILFNNIALIWNRFIVKDCCEFT